ncbi:IGF-like family receptor 1 isoform X2 [Thalassophryne amazonica]|uniref:IGF-like family receptor 1 isoform X2 n=1 Tax=Thalassophryne amazonica TaxID=390379 RepID=UPI001471B7AD|nr:IGF-like family receptor 1 isoform X2 [Thalassophryne amazonica]
MMEGYSHRCPDLKTRWDKTSNKCVLCTAKPGKEITPNCGFDDNGGRHVPDTTPCQPNTFNNGNFQFCQPCSRCPAGFDTVMSCNAMTDTQCRDSRTTERPLTTQTSLRSILTEGTTGTTLFHSNQAASNKLPTTVPLVAFFSATVVVLIAVLIHMKRKKVLALMQRHTRRLSHVNEGFVALSFPPDHEDAEVILSPRIQLAPLQMLLNNLDVLEELVILLDPESPGLKSTRHLASYCSFPSTWITYTYSMKESRSPLRAVLEGVTCKNPEWTVGDLARALRHLGRNDAVTILSKLEQSEMNAAD